MPLFFAKGNYVSRVWFLYRTGEAFDVMMWLSRQLPDAPWVLRYRFRYYQDAKTVDSNDERSEWTATFPDSIDEEAAVTKVAPVLQMLTGRTGLTCDLTMIQTDDPEAALRLMRAKPYFFILGQGLAS